MGWVYLVNNFMKLFLTISPWRSVPVITTMTLGLSLILSFCIWEKFTFYPMLPAILFAQKVESLEMELML
jgi:hypothetical protein